MTGRGIRSRRARAEIARLEWEFTAARADRERLAREVAVGAVRGGGGECAVKLETVFCAECANVREVHVNGECVFATDAADARASYVSFDIGEGIGDVHHATLIPVCWCGREEVRDDDGDH